jgi:hypothetical protein
VVERIVRTARADNDGDQTRGAARRIARERRAAVERPLARRIVEPK